MANKNVQDLKGDSAQVGERLNTEPNEKSGPQLEKVALDKKDEPKPAS